MKLENKLEMIAIFMGCKNIAEKGKYPIFVIPEHTYDEYEYDSDGALKTSNTFGIFFNEMQYNVSWDWLMPVISKILSSSQLENVKELQESLITCSIEQTFESVCNFIEWSLTNK